MTDKEQLAANGFSDSTGRYYVSVQAIGYNKINLGYSGKYIAWDRARVEIECLGFPLPAGMIIHHRFNIMANDAPENLFLLTTEQNQVVQKTLGRIINSPSSFGEQTGKLYEIVQKLSTANITSLLATKELSDFFSSPRQEKSDDSLIMFCEEPEERLL